MELDEDQKKVVFSTEKKIIVSAGAGSGKTRVLTERIRHLLDSGVEPHNIVAITFTNMAADEMRERLVDVAGIGDALVGTIHSFANRLMRESGEHYELFTEEKEIQFMRYLISRYCQFLTIERYLEFAALREKALLGYVDEQEPHRFLDVKERSELYLLMRDVKQVTADTEKCIENGEAIEYPASLWTMCKKNDVITFDELLEKATAYFERLGARVEHVLVDEFQDIGTLEYTFVMGLKAENYFFVGDDWQAIYGFKGGNRKIFMALIANPEFTHYLLVKNYRCGSQIMNCATKVIRAVSDVSPKEVEAVAGFEGSVDIQSRYTLEKTIKRITDYGNWFVLTRSNKDLVMLVQLLEKHGIPTSSFKKGDMTLEEMRKELAKDTVKVLTVHSAKGLEADSVLLYGNFPLKQPSYLMNSEERRVMYVGMTRAKKRLWIRN